MQPAPGDAHGAEVTPLMSQTVNSWYFQIIPSSYISFNLEFTGERMEETVLKYLYSVNS